MLSANADEHDVRSAAFAFLDSLSRRLGGLVRHEDVARFEFRGERLPLLDPQRGIRKPRQLVAAISIRTVYAPDPTVRPTKMRFDMTVTCGTNGEGPIRITPRIERSVRQ